MQDLLTQFSTSPYATQFCQSYYLQLLQEIFAVMTGVFVEGFWSLSCDGSGG